MGAVSSRKRAAAAGLPQDVIGVMMEFHTADLHELHQGPARVCVKWHKAFLDHQPLWMFFCRQRWPKTSRRDLTMEVYRQRRTVEKMCAPSFPGGSPGQSDPSRLTEIENCGFEFAFKCPMLAENLRDVTHEEYYADADRPVLHCSACDKRVFTCTSAAEVQEHAARGDCVRFVKYQRPIQFPVGGDSARSRIRRNGTRKLTVVIIYNDDTTPPSPGDNSRGALLKTNERRAQCVRLKNSVNGPGVRLVSPTMDPLMITFGGNLELTITVESVAVLTQRLGKGGRWKDRTNDPPEVADLSFRDTEPGSNQLVVMAPAGVDLSDFEGYKKRCWLFSQDDKQRTSPSSGLVGKEAEGMSEFWRCVLDRCNQRERFATMGMRIAVHEELRPSCEGLRQFRDEPMKKKKCSVQ